LKYRELGKTGFKTSAIGLGCEHLDGGKPYNQIAETIEAALAAGVNIFDVFMPGKEIREAIAKVLGERRKKVIIQGHIGATDVKQQYDISRDMPTVQKYFEDLLRIYGGHIELGMLFFIDSDEDYTNVFDGGIADYAQKLKKNGDIKHIGFSSHNPKTAMRAINTGLPEMLLFSVNPAFDMLPADKYVFDHMEQKLGEQWLRGLDPERASLYTLCEQKQIGITVMKPLGAGKLLSPEHTPFAKPLTVAQCVHYALSRPAVASVLPGCKTAKEMNDMVQYFNLPEEEKSYAGILGQMRNDFKGSCVYCNHCQPCRANIDIATVHKYLDIAKLDENNIPPSIVSHYQSMKYKGEDCILCGHCESRCPFGVKVIMNMKKADALLN
jgi:hypothetical protein